MSSIPVYEYNKVYPFIGCKTLGSFMLYGYLSKTDKHYPQWWKTESISSEVRNKTRLLTVTTIIQPNFGNFSHKNQRRKINKWNQDWKEVRTVKLSLFADWKILYMENPKDTTRKLLELVKLQDIKLIHRNPLHSYTLTMKTQKEKLRKWSHSPLWWKENT